MKQKKVFLVNPKQDPKLFLASYTPLPAKGHYFVRKKNTQK